MTRSVEISDAVPPPSGPPSPSEAERRPFFIAGKRTLMLQVCNRETGVSLAPEHASKPVCNIREKPWTAIDAPVAPARHPETGPQRQAKKKRRP